MLKQIDELHTLNIFFKLNEFNCIVLHKYIKNIINLMFLIRTFENLIYFILLFVYK